MKKKTAKTVPKAKPESAPLNYEEPVLAAPKQAPQPMQPRVTTPASVIADCSGPGATGRVGPVLAEQILHALQAHGYEVVDEKVPF